MLPVKRSVSDALEVNLRIPLHAGDEVVLVRESVWLQQELEMFIDPQCFTIYYKPHCFNFWNTGQTSPEVQNRGISGAINKNWCPPRIRTMEFIIKHWGSINISNSCCNQAVVKTIDDKQKCFCFVLYQINPTSQTFSAQTSTICKTHITLEFFLNLAFLCKFNWK